MCRRETLCRLHPPTPAKGVGSHTCPQQESQQQGPASSMECTRTKKQSYKQTCSGAHVHVDFLDCFLFLWLLRVTPVKNACPIEGIYRNHQSRRTVCDRLFKCFDFKFFFAQGCDNSDMCDDSDTCAESQLNHLVLLPIAQGLCDNSDMCGFEQI